MGMEHEEKFKVSDRRPRFDDGGLSSPSSPSSQKVEEQKGSPSPEPQPPEAISFAGFILSLGTSSLIHLGEEVDPISGKKEVRMERAREVIDLLSVLEEKTKGNLTPDEESLMSRLLFTLRMKYVEKGERTR
jgi:hypothetical protein